MFKNFLFDTKISQQWIYSKRLFLNHVEMIGNTMEVRLFAEWQEILGFTMFANFAH